MAGDAHRPLMMAMTLRHRHWACRQSVVQGVDVLQVGYPSLPAGQHAVSGDTPQAPTYPPVPQSRAHAGPAALIVDSPRPARTTTMSAGSAEGLLSRCTTPFGT